MKKSFLFKWVSILGAILLLANVVVPITPGSYVYAADPLTVTAKKLTTAPDDLNKEKSQANQDAVTIEQTDDSIIIHGKLAELVSFESTNPGQQDAEHKWIGIDLGTNLASISGATWGGSYTMTQDDVDEASSVWLGAGHIIFWTKADVIKESPATITIGAEGYESVTYTVKFEETLEELTVTAKKLATAPDDLNKEKSQANQDAVTIEQTDDSIIIHGKLAELVSFESTNPGQQDAEHKWIGIDLGTNLASISGATWGGSYTMTQDDVDEASSVWLGAGHIIFWTKADVIKESPATITIGAEGYESATYTVKFEEKTEEKSNGSSWWWGGWSSRITNTDNTKATTWDTAKVDENNTEENNEEQANEENKDEEKVAPMTEAQAVEKFGQEQIDAYKWALENGITTMKTVEAARLDQPLTRAELAKMMVVYIQKVLEKDPIVTGDVSYPDVKEELGDLYGYIKLAYQYQIMGINADGTPIEFFNPNGLVTRWEYATVFSRVLFGDKFNKSGEDFYTKHLEALEAAWILTNTIPTIQEMRGWVMLMMYRSSQNAESIEKVANTTEANEERKADEETTTPSDETKSEANEEEKAEEATNTEATTGDVAETPATQESSETTAENTETTAEATTWDVAEAPTAEASTWDTASN